MQTLILRNGKQVVLSEEEFRMILAAMEFDSKWRVIHQELGSEDSVSAFEKLGSL